MNKNKTLVVPKNSCDFKGKSWGTIRDLLLQEKGITFISTNKVLPAGQGIRGQWVITYHCPNNNPETQSVIWSTNKKGYHSCFMKDWAIYLILNEDK